MIRAEGNDKNKKGVPNDLNDPAFAAPPEGEQVNWNTKVDPVPFGYEVDRYGSFPVQTDRPKSVPYNLALEYLNEMRGKGGDDYKLFVKQLQRYNNSESSSASGIETMWRNVLDDAEASGRNVYELLARGPAFSDTSGGGSGGGGYSGPRSSVVYQNENDLRSTANTVASTVLGRGITDNEFKKILKQVRVAERQQPTVTTPGVGTSVTQEGLTAGGRQDIIRDALMKGPEAEDYAKATTMMGIFNKALESRPDGA